MKKSITVFIPVSYLNGIWKGDFKDLPANKSFELIVDYPLSEPASFTLRTGKKGMNLIRLLKEVGKAYQKIYDRMDKYDVCGHDIDDLSVQGVNVDYAKKKITLDMGS